MPANTTTYVDSASKKSQSLASPITEWFVDDEFYYKEGDNQYCLAWNTTGSMTDRLCVFRIQGGNATSVLDILYSDIESYRFSQSFDTKIKYPMAIFRYRPGLKTRYVGVKLILDLNDAADKEKYQDLLSHTRKRCEGVECSTSRMQDIWQFGKNPANGAPSGTKTTRSREDREDTSYPQAPKKRRFASAAPRNPRIRDSSANPRSRSSTPERHPTIPPSVPEDSDNSDPKSRQTADAPKEVIDLTELSDECSTTTKVEDTDANIPGPKETTAATDGDVTMVDPGSFTVHEWLQKADLIRYRDSLESIGLVEWKDLCRFANLSKDTQKAFMTEYVKDMSALHLLFFTEALKELQSRI